MIEMLRTHSIEFGIELSDVQLQQFNRYYELLIEWNGKINLTALTQPFDVAVKHFVDSLSLSKPMTNKNGERLKLIDIGTGAGFPGIPLKIFYPQLQVTLLDSLNKRLKFLQKVVEELELTGVELVHGRAEENARSVSHRERYDYATARAVARLNILCELCLPFVKKGGYFLAQKGAAAGEEVIEARNALKILGGEIVQCIDVNLPQLADARTLIVIQKKHGTPANYPRKAGIPERKPL